MIAGREFSTLRSPSAPRLTALIVTYNQREFLTDAFASVQSQSIFDRIDVVISDDASTDGTFDLAQSLAASLQNVAVRQNRTNLGVMAHYREVVAGIETEFMAILEGDDVWRDAHKLEKQLEFMDLMPNINASFTGYTVQYEGGKSEARRNLVFADGQSGLLCFEDILEKNHGATFTNYMYRTAALKDVLSLDVVLKGYDWLVNLLMADRSPIGYLNGDFATYWVRKSGEWSRLNPVEKKMLIVETLSALGPQVDARHRLIVEDKIKMLEAIQRDH